MSQSNNFRRKLLPSCIAASLVSLVSLDTFAQENLEEVVVTGVRGAQERAIDIKRSSATMVDAVSAEDIGKLPDVTIADSLQRVTGVQIQRSGGQGSSVSIRGMGQALSTMNGEYFLLPASMTTNGVNFTDMPASLVSGLTVSKSSSASQLEGGIGGSIDLLTRKSLDMDEGLSGSTRLQVGSGSITSSTDPEISGLVGWNHEDKLATSLAVSYGDSTLANNQGRLRADRVAESWDCSSVCADLDGNGTTDGDFINPLNWQSPELSSREIERQRLGLAYNFNLAVSDAIEVNADVFYTEMDEKAAGQFMYLGNQIGGRAGFHEYTIVTGNPAIINPGDGTLGGQPFYATDMNTMVSGFRGGVLGTYRDSSALNKNFEVNYDNGGAFTGSVRWVSGKADQDSNELTLAQVSNAHSVVREEGGTAVNINPGAIDDGLIYPMHVQVNSDNVLVELDPTMVEKLANPDAWYLHSGWVESTQSEANVDVLRFDGSFAIADEGVTSVDFGLRYSNRDVANRNMSFFSPSGVVVDGVELLNKYHEVGYAIGQSGTTGTAQGLTYDPLPVIEITDSILDGYITNVTDFGEVAQGFDVNIPMIDTGKIDDPLAFLDKLYGKGERIINPDRSYKVAEAKQSLYAQFNFEKQLSDNVRLSGNSGLRFVQTDLTVTRNITDPNKLNPLILAGVDPNHTTYTDLGDEVTNVSYNHFLPSLNLNLDISDEYKIRLTYDKRMSLQNLNSLGDGSITYYSSEEGTETFQRVSSRQNNGNPYLNPWESTVFNLAGEWYPSESTIVALGYFHMDIASFTFSDSVHNPGLTDSDGVARRGAEERTISNGSGGTVSGLEFSYQQSFDHLDGFFGNTGVTFNYTYSPSESPSDQILPNGEVAPFNSTAENQANIIVWYQDDKFEARIAANYLGEQYQGLTSGWMWAPTNDAEGMPMYMESTLFIDITTSYNITDDLQVTLAVNNLTEEDNITYTQWDDFKTNYDLFERRITAGVNFKF
ncbi:TonB-dependent receptor [Saccharophagus degradans]|uniref:TonB-dependent receptor n=1 Tax=Saccharophagus degradans TaxID=86304 RepID=UPI001C0A343D|nr:TonB-dependent receptor [Saccharophagus degradans]MBU2986670.1 TonB-dependent receptor [Saccharophagus degradans]